VGIIVGECPHSIPVAIAAYKGRRELWDDQWSPAD